jgi:DNA topoisomerase-2
LYDKFLNHTLTVTTSNNNDEKVLTGEEEDFQYLLGMPIHSLTLEKKKQLEKEVEKKQSEIRKYRSETSTTLWRKDIKEFLKKLDI